MADVKTAELLAQEKYVALCATAQVKEFVASLTPETWVNLCPIDTVNRILNDCTEVQNEYTNPTDYKVRAIEQGVLAHGKQLCNWRIGIWKRFVEKFAAKSPDMSRNQVIDELLKMRSSKEMEKSATIAEAVLDKLSKM